MAEALCSADRFVRWRRAGVWGHIISAPRYSELDSAAAKETLYWTDLRTETVLLNQDDCGREIEDLLMSKLVSSDDRPMLKRHDISRGIIKSLVSIGFGVSLVTESDIGASFSGLVYREIRDGSGPSRIGYSAHWRADNDNPALAGFLRLLKERYPSPAA